MQGEAADDDDAGGAPDELRFELVPRVVAVEQAGDHDAWCRRRSASGCRTGRSPNSPRLNVPQMPAKTCTATAPIGSSQRRLLHEVDAERHDDAGDRADHDGARTARPSSTGR